MAEDTWPEFLYGGMTIAEYVRHVVAIRDAKSEVVALVDLLQDLVDHPFHPPEKTFQYVRVIAHAQRALLAHSSSITRASAN
jgi:hypothetical protein